MRPIEERLGLSDVQRQKLRAYQAMVADLNRLHNLVSAGSLETCWEHHIRHALALAHRTFPAGATVVDWGTGGGLPAVPLAIVLTSSGIDARGPNLADVRAF